MLSRFFWFLGALSPLLGLAAPAAAGLIDFEALPSDQFIDGLNLGGVTILNPFGRRVSVYDNEYGVSFHSPTKAISSNDFMEFETTRLAAVFDSPQSFVRLWAGNSGAGIVRGWLLEAFDAAIGGNSLGLVQNDTWSGAPYMPLEIAAPHIVRIEFGLRDQSHSSGIGFDDLEFTPEPAAILLLLPLAYMIRSPMRGE